MCRVGSRSSEHITEATISTSLPDNHSPESLYANIKMPRLLDLLHLEETNHDVFRAKTIFEDPINLYGGQVAAQALRAAGTTVPQGRTPHSFHCYFLRAGDPRLPVDYFVNRDRDGRAYSARTVSAMQDGREILTMSTSFHVEEEGPDIQPSGIPDVLFPDDPRAKPMKTRTVDIDYRDPRLVAEDTMVRQIWAKATVDLGDDPLLHACVTAYVSDMFTGLFTLTPRRNDVALSSLDHAMWFLRPARADEWFFMELFGESLNGGRGLYSGSMFNERGELIARIMQESLFRARKH